MSKQKLISEIKNKIINRLNQELPQNLYYHVSSHTDDVYNRVTYLGKNENLSAQEIELLQVAAIYHDTGFINQYNQNEPIGAEIAANDLPNYNFTNEEIAVVKKLIMATVIPHNPQTLSEKIIADADMDNLGRDDFYIQTELLRLELKENGITFSPRQWYAENLPKLLKMHTYYTKTALQDRDPLKQKHLQEILELTGQ